jgi:serine/threonine protein phosphatase PrpC
MRKELRRQQQRPPLKVQYQYQRQKQKQRNATTTASPEIDGNNTTTATNCPSYGCPIYPPELTIPLTNQTIRKALESSGRLLPSSSSLSKAGQQQPRSDGFRIGFASGSFATLSQQGKSHAVNQDRGVFVSPFLPDLLSKKSFLACIFDGHGTLGHEVAQEVVERFPLLLTEKLTLALGDDFQNTAQNNNVGRNNKGSHNQTILVRPEDYDSTDRAIRKALNETFVEVNEKGTPYTFYRGGCTASVTLRWGSKLYIANTGDSETIVVSASPPPSRPQQNPGKQRQQQNNFMVANVEYNTRRDKANQPAERERIEKLGGKIHINDRGFDPRVIVHSEVLNDTIALAMSRSIGDWEWKAVGVTAEPTIDLLDLSRLPVSNRESTTFLLAASDGFWDLRQKHFYATQLAESFRKGNQNARDENNGNAHFRPLYHIYDMMQRITPKAQTGYRDDITVTIASLE